MKLLDEAKKIGVTARTSHYSPEEVELAVAWAKGEVGYSQVRVAMKLAHNSGVYCFLARALQRGFQSGLIEEVT